MISNQVLSKMVDNAVQARLQQVKEELSHELKVSNALAEDIIRGLIGRFKSDGKTEIGAIDIHSATKLPFEQISRILDKLRTEGVISDGA